VPGSPAITHRLSAGSAERASVAETDERCPAATTALGWQGNHARLVGSTWLASHPPTQTTHSCSPGRGLLMQQLLSTTSTTPRRALAAPPRQFCPPQGAALPPSCQGGGPACPVARRRHPAGCPAACRLAAGQLGVQPPPTTPAHSQQRFNQGSPRVRDGDGRSECLRAGGPTRVSARVQLQALEMAGCQRRVVGAEFKGAS
jgi:hypothetical protein